MRSFSTFAAIALLGTTLSACAAISGIDDYSKGGCSGGDCDASTDVTVPHLDAKPDHHTQPDTGHPKKDTGADTGPTPPADAGDGGQTLDAPMDTGVDGAVDAPPDAGAECVIGGVTYRGGISNPTNACEICQSSMSMTAWTNLSDGTSCGTGDVCSVGACAAGCFIGGTVYASAAANPANACQSCQSGTSTTAWTNIADGAGCGTGEVCSMGACGAGCFIGGMVVAPAAANPSNVCQTCQPATSTTAWSNLTDGTGCGTGLVCASGQCGTTCVIGGTDYSTGTVNPADPCQSCQPAKSTSQWSNLANGTSCGSGEVCNSASCAPGCFISGVAYSPGAVNPNNSCQSCQPGTSTTVWSSAANGTSCGVGDVCNIGSCGSGCFIVGVVYAPGNANPSNACQSCQPAKSTTGWSTVSDGTACAGSEVCKAGFCTSGCFIGGTFYAPATANPSNACQTCQPATNDTAWTNLTNGTSCGNGQICAGGACGSTCDIGGTDYPSGTINPTNACQSCQPGASTSAWSNLNNNTSCGTGSSCCSGNCTALNTTSNCTACGDTCNTSESSNTSCNGATCKYTCDPGFADCTTGSPPDLGGCTTPTNTTSNCAGCGNVCKAVNASADSCAAGLTCSYTCNSGFSDCNQGTAPDTDGCECSTPGCCSGACQTTHSNGVGQSYYDCNPLSTFNVSQGTEACGAYALAHGGTVANCSDGWECSMKPPTFVCFGNTAGTTCTGPCWGYDSPISGEVVGCSCPTAETATWD